jgi:homogentisate 1,2-dioxygenase
MARQVGIFFLLSKYLLTSFVVSYIPYKYDLNKFIFVGSISKDHIDPSIFCVLTAPSKQAGVPLTDFLLFSGRWDIADGTFRPPVR